ncbi:glycosyltransferase family 8 protein [Paenibacillus sp. P32E]|uniref:glycosyltransferase family 8 protein n=1 Tax=Paenibacillus sp. P32E TaxID=1349434 RepID=UPI00093B569C|nr:glycosyltransferase family 8 protein [Paenibacillus sp. P32E]OKP82955.1 hypothetical protein A3848_26970 [Paenibacillus sp. P32E]
MVDLVLTINDKDGSYTEHAGVVLASVFANTQQMINVHIVHDDSLSEENKLKLTQLVDVFHHNIFFYHVSIPWDMQEVAAGVHKIDYWTMASMYRLLLPIIIQADRVIYLDCDILVNMDINELWSIDLGEHYLGAVLDQGENLLEYFISLGLSAELYFNSGVILFQLNNIRGKENWYGEMLDFLRNYPTMTMPDQDILNAVYSSNYLQMDQRFNTFAHSDLDLENKIVHFAGDNKWWDVNSPNAPIYNNYLAMTPWARELTPVPVSEPAPADIPAEPPAGIPAEPPAGILAEPPAPEIQLPETSVLENPAPEVPAPSPEIPVKRHRRKRRRTLRLIRRLRRRRMIRAKYRSIKRARLIKYRYAKRKVLKLRRRKLRSLRRKSRYVIHRVSLKKSKYTRKRKRVS